MLFHIIKYFWRFISIIYEAFIVLILLLLFLNYYIRLWLVYDCFYYIPDSIYYKYWNCKNIGIYLTLNYSSSSFISVLFWLRVILQTFFSLIWELTSIESGILCMQLSTLLLNYLYGTKSANICCTLFDLWVLWINSIVSTN